jgi:hypothetical protein
LSFSLLENNPERTDDNKRSKKTTTTKCGQSHKMIKCTQVMPGTAKTLQRNNHATLQRNNHATLQCNNHATLQQSKRLFSLVFTFFSFLK